MKSIECRCFLVFLTHYPKEISFLGRVKDDSLAVGGRWISVWRNQTFGFPIYFAPAIISLIRGKVWYNNESR
ncbi:hypothetical protein FPL01_10295 [Bacillus pacificus]|uniref:Uncharacterized protein n=1 Tax=Bacillus pacificus TaxID=2026187 RepID=A0ABX6I2S5_9BACI|nr:hypothetical protein AT277_12835 [Bacillus cereus]KXY94292.1 hypothetical protein AT276_12450 [Bacillus cereus]PEB06011.1 hypothetical protein COM56_15555 [Bacillus cereus]QHH89107.1 hypothetical protein FPL01_10295 [Bacillus pacificus]RRB08055.1 hypothetical protein EH195_00205 [Bacillus pacificus]